VIEKRKKKRKEKKRKKKEERTKERKKPVQIIPFPEYPDLQVQV